MTLQTLGDFWTQDMLDDVMVALLFAHSFPGSFSLVQHLPLFYHPWLYGCIAPTERTATDDTKPYDAGAGWSVLVTEKQGLMPAIS